MSTVLVTDASSGIGLLLVKQFLRQKDLKMIIGTSRKPSAAKELLAIWDPRLHVIEMDAASKSSITHAAKKVAKIVGKAGLSVLINNSETPYVSKGDQLDRPSLIQQFDVNSLAPLICFQAFRPLLQKASKAVGNAKVITVSSFQGSLQMFSGSSDRHFMPYNMSKGTVNMLTKALSIESAKDNIYAYAFCPGWVRTDLGNRRKPFTVEESTAALVSTISNLTKQQSGDVLDRQLKPILH